MSRRALRFASSLLAALLLVLVTLPALGAKKSKKAEEPEPAAEEVSLDEEGEDKAEPEESSDEGEADEEKKEEASEEKGDEETPSDSSSDGSPVEIDGKTYHFVGLRYRLILIPEFVMGLFGQGGETLPVNSFGPEFTIRKDGFEYTFAIAYTPYTMDQVPFKAPDDPEIAWEVVDSRLKVLYLMADFMWSQELSKELAFTYGGGAGIGLVFGDLYRTQAYLEDGVYKPCVGNLNPPVTTSSGAFYCEDDPDHGDDQHYPGYTEPSWANGGSKPIIFPWLAIQAGLRFKPHKNFVGRLELGIGLGQVFFGIGADYGL